MTTNSDLSDEPCKNTAMCSNVVERRPRAADSWLSTYVSCYWWLALVVFVYNSVCLQNYVNVATSVVIKLSD